MSKAVNSSSAAATAAAASSSSSSSSSVSTSSSSRPDLADESSASSFPRSVSSSSSLSFLASAPAGPADSTYLDVRRPSQSSTASNTTSPLSSSFGSRRPSAASSSFVSTRRPSNVSSSSRSAVTATSSPPQSPPTTPTLRSGSRNRILASASAVVGLDGGEPVSRAVSTSPLPRALSTSPPPSTSTIPNAYGAVFGGNNSSSGSSSYRSHDPSDWAGHRRLSSASSSSHNNNTFNSSSSSNNTKSGEGKARAPMEKTREEGGDSAAYDPALSTTSSSKARRGSATSGSASVAERKKRLANAAEASGREFDGVSSSTSAGSLLSGGGGGGGSGISGSTSTDGSGFLASLRRRNSKNGGPSTNPAAPSSSSAASSSSSHVQPNSIKSQLVSSTSGSSLSMGSRRDIPAVVIGDGADSASLSESSSSLGTNHSAATTNNHSHNHSSSGAGGGDSVSTKTAKSSLKARLFGLKKDSTGGSSKATDASRLRKPLNSNNVSANASSSTNTSSSVAAGPSPRIAAPLMSRRGVGYDGSDLGDAASTASGHSGAASSVRMPFASPFFTPPLGLDGDSGGGESGNASEEALGGPSSFADSIDARLNRIDSGSKLSAGLSPLPREESKGAIKGSDPFSSSFARATKSSSSSASSASASASASAAAAARFKSGSSSGDQRGALTGLGLDSVSIPTSRSHPLQLSVPAREDGAQRKHGNTDAAGSLALEPQRSRSPGGTVLRMDSWPPREKRSSSFVSVKSAGTGGGYRFENVAGRAMKGSESMDSNSLDRPPTFLQMDPARKTQRPVPAASTDPARPGTSPKLGSPASLQADRFERSSVRPGIHRADSSSSSFGGSGSRGPPQTRFSRSSSSSSVSSRPTTSEGTRPRPAHNGAAFALAAVTTDSPIERPRHVKRPSTHHGRSDRDSVSSMASFASSAHSPGSVSLVPRSSSLRNARMVSSNSASNITSATSPAAEMASSQPSPPLPPRMSSSTRSIGKSIDSSSTTTGEASRFDSEREEHTESKVIIDSGGSGSGNGSRSGYKTKRASLLDLEARHGPPGLRQAASSAAGAAGAGALAAIRARFGDGTPLKLAKPSPAAVEPDDEEVRDKVTHLRGDEAPTYFDAASPESMKTARAELSPVSTMAINDGGLSSISPPDFVTDLGGSLYPVSSHESDIIMMEANSGYNGSSSSGTTNTNANTNAIEPQRPQKNPLRFRHPAPMHSPPPPPPPPSSTKPISVGTPSPETLRAIEQRQRMRMALGASPPRRSIEEVAPMGAIMASSLSSISSYDVENAVTPASPSTLQTGMPIWNEDVKLKPVPATARRRSKTFRPGSASGLKLEDSPRMHSGSVSGSPRPSASPMMRGSPNTSSQGMERLRTNSLRMRATRASSVDEDANAAAASASQLSLDSNGDVQSSASQEGGAAAAAVAAVAAAAAAGGSTASHGTATSSNTPSGSTTAHRYMSLRKATPPSFGVHKDEQQQQQKKTSKWKPFSNDATKDEGSPANSSTSLSFASKLGRKTTKSRKSDPALARPQIRRIFDGQDIDSPGATPSPGIDEQHEPQQGVHALGEAFRRNGSTPSLGAKTKSNHSLDAASKMGSPGPNAGAGAVAGTAGGMLNSPASVGTPVEEMTGEMKRILKRRNVIRELVETEKSYASDLAVVRDVYLARAKAKAGMSATSILHTPLSAALTSSGSTPIPSPGGSGIGLGPPPPLQPPSSAGAMSSALSRGGGLANQRFPSPAIGPSTTTSGTYSPSFASSSDPGNRSSMFTVSSTTSQTSDSSFPFSTANAPPLPATPPTMVAGMTTSTSSGQLSQLSQLSSSISGGTIHGHTAANIAPSSSSSANLSINAQSATSPQPPPTPHSAPGRPSVHVSTASHVLMAGALGSPDAPLTPSDIRIIFAHLEQCAVFADEMAAILEGVMGSLALSSSSSLRAATGQSSTTTATATAAEEADAEDDRIGRAFLGLMPRIETVYTAYCSRHEASMARLNEVSAHSGRASAFFKDCTEVARKHTNAWDLASLLIKPVQRVLKYPLLIQQIRAATSISHPDYECLTSALEEIGRVADNINEVKKRKDIAGFIIAGSRTASTSSSRQRTLTGAEGGYGAGETVVTTPPPGTKRGKKFKDKSGRLSMLATPTSDHAFDNYATIVERFMTLRRHVEQFAQQVLAWSLNLRDHYEAELRLLTQMRNVMRLKVPPPSDPATAGTPEESRSSSVAAEDEMAVAASLERIQAYQVLIHAIIKTSWRPMHSEIEHNIIPMTDRLLQMFDNPLSVMAKRDEREADYMRFRAMKSDKSLDKRAIESVNGFIALHAQLLDELPQFIFGVLTLLDVGVQAFARIQAAHHLDVRRAVLDYWRINSPNPNEVTHVTAGGEATIKHVHPVRAYWSAHQRTSEILETLRITTPEGHGVFASSAGMPLATMAEMGPEGDNEGGILEGGEDNYGFLAPPMPPLPSFIRSQSANSSPNPSRRPSGVAGLMRTISGTFSKEHSPVPNSPRTPLPTMPPSSESLAKAPEGPPLLPSLVFRTDGDDGFFIQNSPIPFLDDDPNGPKKEPYLGNSPAVALLPELLPEVDQGTSSTMTLPPPVPSKTHSDDSLDVQQQQQQQQKPPMSPRTRQRHKMPVLYTLVANESSLLDSQRQQEDRMGWPWLAFESGDKLRVLSTTSKSESNEALAGKAQDDDDETILFGRIDRTGKLGWAERIKFASAASSSPSPLST